MPLAVHSGVKTVELIHYQLMQSLDQFEQRLDAMRKRQAHSFVWPIFSAIIAVGALHAKIATDVSLVYLWIGAALLYLFVYFVVYRQILHRLWVLIVGLATERRPLEYRLNDPAVLFDQKTTNELLLAYSLVQAANSSGEEPQSEPGIELYITEAAHYLRKGCADLSRVAMTATQVDPKVLAGGIQDELAPGAVDRYRLETAVGLAEHIAEEILSIAMSSEVVSKVAYVKDSVLPGIRDLLERSSH